MKINRLFSMFLSVFTAGSVFFAHASAEGVICKVRVSADRSETVIMFSDRYNKDEYRINESGSGTFLFKNPRHTVYISARIKDTSKIPEGLYIYEKEYLLSLFSITAVQEEEIYGADNGWGDVYFLRDNMLGTMYNIDIDKAIGIAESLRNTEGISDIRLYREEMSYECWISGCKFRVFRNDGYIYDRNDFAELTEKGYDVSLYEENKFPGSGELKVNIIPPGFKALDEDERMPALYRAMLDALGLNIRGGVFLIPVFNVNRDEPERELIRCSIPGDANLDLAVDLYDAIGIAKYIAGAVSLTDTEKETADFNGDEKIDLYDAIGIAEMLVRN